MVQIALDYVLMFLACVAGLIVGLLWGVSHLLAGIALVIVAVGVIVGSRFYARWKQTNDREEL